MSLYHTHVWFTLKMTKSSGLTLVTLDSYVIARAHPFKSHKPCIPGATQNGEKVDQNFAGGRDDETGHEREFLTFAVIEASCQRQGERIKRGPPTHCEIAKSEIQDKGNYPRRNKRPRPRTRSTMWLLCDRPVLRLLVSRRVD